MTINQLTILSSRPVVTRCFGVLLGTALLAGSVLVGASVYADDDSTVVDHVNAIVPVACTMSGGDNTYSTSITPGQTAELGPTNIKTVCNDPAGYSIYAIGFTGDSYSGDNTKMIGANTDIKINTGTSGDDSYWAMKLEAVTGTYAPTIMNSFDSYHAVPSTFTQVAKLTSNTDGGELAIGSNLHATYKVKTSVSQTADTYTGKVKYVLVHPNTAPAPPEPVVTDPGYISYNPNDNGVTDSMGDQSIADTDTSAELWASNFQRSGYGFAGWTDKYDWVLNENDADGNGTGANAGYHIYGPNQTISFTAGQYSGDNPGLSLYAVWVPSAGDLQGYTCPNNTTMPVGTVTALTDTRDNQTYTIAKLKDNKCWMVENLRLDNQYTTGAANIAKAQGYNSSFIGLADPETANFEYSTTANSLYSIDGSTSAPAITGSYQAYRFPRYNNQNTSNPATNMIAWDNNSNTYSVGNYYTWHAAIADTTHYTSGDHNTTSICPSGWHIPTGNTSGEYRSLNTAQNAGSTSSSTGLRAYPANFIYSGNFVSSSAGDRGANGYYWSSTAYNYYYSYVLSFYSSSVLPGTNHNNAKSRGLSVRCSL